MNATPLRAVTLKLFDTYGPNDPRNNLSSLLRSAADARVPLAISPGEQLMDLVFVDDVVDAYLAAVRRLQVPEVMHEHYPVSTWWAY